MKSVMHQHGGVEDNRSTVRHHRQESLNCKKYPFKIDVEVPVEDIFSGLFERSKEPDAGICKNDIDLFEALRDAFRQCLYLCHAHGIRDNACGTFSKGFDCFLYGFPPSAGNNDLGTFVEK